MGFFFCKIRAVLVWVGLDGELSIPSYGIFLLQGWWLMGKRKRRSKLSIPSYGIFLLQDQQVTARLVLNIISFNSLLWDFSFASEFEVDLDTGKVSDFQFPLMGFFFCKSFGHLPFFGPTRNAFNSLLWDFSFASIYPSKSKFLKN